MKLYQHLCYCSVAMQHFLDENPDYWSFIPQRLTVYEEQEQEREIKFVDHHQYQFANDVPVPTNMNYHFTTEQKLNIEEFFQQKKYLTQSNSHFDFYQASIIAVLPEKASSVLRRFVETLFITHAQTKLNTFGHLDADDSSIRVQSNGELCYENLVRPSI
ncbi:unnamed protein product [Rotaria magnacalcarata]|nr:unnamed protein product [Rotaria magnacalcarata]